MKQHKTG